MVENHLLVGRAAYAPTPCVTTQTAGVRELLRRRLLAVVALHELPDESEAAAVRAWVPSAAFRAAVRTVALSTVEFYVGVVDALVDDADGTLSGGETMH